MTQRVFNSFFAIRNSISNRRINANDLPYEETDREKRRNEAQKELKNPLHKVFTKSQFRSLKKESPFTKYYNPIILKWKRDLQGEKFDSSLPKNDFYNPSLFSLISDYLYMIPFWTKILVKKIKPDLDIKYGDKDKLENNPVENYFDIFKNKLLQNKLSTPSEICSVTYPRLLHKYNEFYKGRKDEISPNLTEEIEDDEGIH